MEAMLIDKAQEETTSGEGRREKNEVYFKSRKIPEAKYFLSINFFFFFF